MKSLLNFDIIASVMHDFSKGVSDLVAKMFFQFPDK